MGVKLFFLAGWTVGIYVICGFSKDCRNSLKIQQGIVCDFGKTMKGNLYCEKQNSKSNEKLVGCETRMDVRLVGWRWSEGGGSRGVDRTDSKDEFA